MMMRISCHFKCAAFVVVEAMLEIKETTAQMKLITEAVIKVATNKMML